MVHQEKWKFVTRKRAGKRDFLDYCLAEKSMHFLAKGVAKNVRERAMPGKEGRKGLIAKINANNLCQRKLFWNNDHVLGDKRHGDKDEVWERGGAEGWGGGGEGVWRIKGIVSTITCNLAVPATHHRISAIPRI
jgi:hypothetical protein